MEHFDLVVAPDSYSTAVILTDIDAFLFLQLTRMLDFLLIPSQYFLDTVEKYFVVFEDIEMVPCVRNSNRQYCTTTVSHTGR